MQELIPLEQDSGELKLTVAYYYLPSGRLVHRKKDATDWGVDPADPGATWTRPSNRRSSANAIETEIFRKPGTVPLAPPPPPSPTALDVQLQRAVDTMMALVVLQDTPGLDRRATTEPTAQPAHSARRDAEADAVRDQPGVTWHGSSASNRPAMKPPPRSSTDGTRVLSSVVAIAGRAARQLPRRRPRNRQPRPHREHPARSSRMPSTGADVTLADLDAIAVTHRPGLIGSLLIGVTAAKTLAWALGKPADRRRSRPAPISTASCSAASSSEPQIFPAVGLAISGGHTALYDLQLLRRRATDRLHHRRCRRRSLRQGRRSSWAWAIPAARSSTASPARATPQAIRFPRTPCSRDQPGLLLLRPQDLRALPRPRLQGQRASRRRPHASSRSPTSPPASRPPASMCSSPNSNARSTQTRAKSVIIGGGVSANRGLRAALPKLGRARLLPRLRILHRQRRHVRRPGPPEPASQGQTAALDLDAITNSELGRPSPDCPSLHPVVACCYSTGDVRSSCRWPEDRRDVPGDRRRLFLPSAWTLDRRRLLPFPASAPISPCPL